VNPSGQARGVGSGAGGSGAVLEAPAFVAGLDDLAVMSEAVEQGCRHLGVAMSREVHVRLCVQRRLACSAGDKPAGAKVRAP
jgi:hypothetical protein